LNRLGIIVNFFVDGKIQPGKLGTFVGCPVLKGIFWLNDAFCGGYEALSSQWGSGTEAVATLEPSCSWSWKVKAQSAACCMQLS